MKQTSSWLLASALLLSATTIFADNTAPADTSVTPTAPVLEEITSNSTQDTPKQKTNKQVTINREEVLKNLNLLVEKTHIVPEKVFQQLQAANTAGEELSDEFLSDLIKKVLSLSTPQTTNRQDLSEINRALNDVQTLLIAKLKSYSPTGVAFTFDPNGAFFVDNQDPKFTVTYRNKDGEVKTKTFQASIDSFGIKVEFAHKLSWIFFTGTDSNFYNTNKEIHLRKGIELGGTLLAALPLGMIVWDFVHNPSFEDLKRARNIYLLTLAGILLPITITYVPFDNTPGGLIILSYSLGLTFNVGSAIKGGTLTPVTE